MNYDLTPDQFLLIKKYMDFSTQELAPDAEIMDRAPVDEIKSIMTQNIKKLGEVGFLGMAHEEKFGGSNSDLVSLAIAGETISKYCSSTFLTAMTSSLKFGKAIAVFGTEAQKEEYLPSMIQGDTIGAVAVYESEAGSDNVSISANAEKKGDAWVLNGAKTFVTNVPIANTVLVAAYTNASAGPEAGITCFLVNTSLTGITREKVFDKMGFRGSLTGEFILENCEVPESAVLGEPGKGYEIIEMIKNYGRLGMAMASLGIAVACMDEASSHSKERKTFGRIINRYQEVAFKLSDMMIHTDLSRLIIYKACRAIEEKNYETATLVSCAKLFASESATKVANLALQVHGGHGYMKDSRIERLYRDAKLGDLCEGTSEIQRVEIARSVFDKV
ncbi:MAG: acyl-CoA dehydrogenase [bacterium]|nr:acyl-CoA dehydrogenase [bacterium]